MKCTLRECQNENKIKEIENGLQPGPRKISYSVPLVTNLDSQNSELIALNMSFTMFSSKINVQVLILK